MVGYCIFSPIQEMKNMTLIHRSRAWQRLWLIKLLSLILAGSFVTGSAEEISFNRDVRPILSANCFSCHGPDKKARKAKLRLDTRDGALFDLGGYRALEPGKADDSELIQRIETDDPDDQMPPPDSGHELTTGDRRVLREWVKAGGEYDTHWSLKRPGKAPLPNTRQKDWPKHPLDHFILKQLEVNKMSPSEDADRYRWIRRVSLDLNGLPPSLEEANAFVADKSEKAYEKVVDRLLDSSAYGEHWARMWLDLARYADTKGYEKDRHREIWGYRDWVIDALNDDMPYDQFTTEQLAGDLLPDPTPDQLVATAFHRNTMSNDEGGTDNEEFRVAAVKDRVDSTVQVWMGLTMGCAKCHSHKYDPITNEEYYGFYAYFNQTEDNDHPNDSPVYRVTLKSNREKYDSLKKELVDKTTELEKAKKAELPELLEWLKGKKSLEEKWAHFTPKKATSRNGATLTIRDDHSVLASGHSPATDQYELTGILPTGTYHTLRLDALTHASLGNRNGPGRNPRDPNFVLSEITIERLPAKGGSAQVLKVISATADFEQKGWPVRGAFDGNPKTGWAISSRFNSDHLVRFTLDQPLVIKEGDQVRIGLSQQYGAQLCFGRIRLTGGKPGTEKISLPALQIVMLSSLVKEGLTPSRRQLVGELHANGNSELNPLKQQIASLKAEIAKIEKSTTTVPVMREKPAGKKRTTRIHKRGNFLDQGDKVSAGFPKLFQSPENLPSNRLGVVRWLMAPENPLTARVMVNRVWARFFGIGIVETEEDFGSQGLMPSHPKLLDWLAVDFMEQGWSLKRLMRVIALSRTYRQDSKFLSENLAKDPRNRLLGRGPRFRLSAEVVRDQSLAASGLLARKIGGPSVMPPQPPGVWKSTYSGEKWKTATGPDRYRRGLYTYLKRTSPHPAMITFDAGSGEVCQIRRIRTNTPLQALITLNDEAYLEAAGALARQMEKSSDNLEQQINLGFRKVLTRPPEPEELKRLVSLYNQLKPQISDKATFLSSANLKEGDPSLVALASVLLNLDETLMKP
jgi:hypothetical protein